MLRGETDAETCRLNGWTVGTRLVGDDGRGPETIQITAIGDEVVVARVVDVGGTPVNRWEAMWMLSCREWSEVKGGDA